MPLLEFFREQTGRADYPCVLIFFVCVGIAYDETPVLSGVTSFVIAAAYGLRSPYGFFFCGVAAVFLLMC
jgi:hypothetical protein